MLWVSGLVLALAVAGSHAQTRPDFPPLGIDGVTERNINGIRFISPVTAQNFATVMARVRERSGVRPLSAEASNRLMTDTPNGTYYYAYGFQLVRNWQQSANFLVTNDSGADWHHYELQKLGDGSILLTGLTTQVDLDKFDYYSKTYGPTPKLISRPADNYNILVLLPYDMVGKVSHQEVTVGQVVVSTVDAAIFPIQEE